MTRLDGTSAHATRRTGSRLGRALLTAALVSAFAATPASALELDGYDWAAADLFIVRPLGLGSLAMGTGFFLLASPFTFMFNNEEIFEDALDRCVLTPGEYVFTRPLGEF